MYTIELLLTVVLIVASPIITTEQQQLLVNNNQQRPFLINISGKTIQMASSDGNDGVGGARGGLFGAGGRFKGGTDPIMEKFNESISFDKRYVNEMMSYFNKMHW